MKYRLLVLVLLLFACKKEQIDEPGTMNPGNNSGFAIDVGNSEVPYIIIDTKGQAIKNEPKIPAEMTIYIKKAEVQSANIGIEYRGSTSFRLSDKKSFGIETWDEAGNDLTVSFFGFPEEEDWILMGHVVNLSQGYLFDPTLMYHQFGYELFRKMDRYASRTKFVELEVNGIYQGVYVFMEKLKRDKERIAIKKLEATDTDSTSITGGYILKIDKTAGGNLNIDQPLGYFERNWQDDALYTVENSFRSQYDIFRDSLSFEPYNPPYHDRQYLETYFLYEYPKAENITSDQKDYIQQYIHDFETALLTDDFSTDQRTYTDFIDVASFVDFLIINEVTRNVDGYRLSTYMYKDRDEKLKMGPIWDLNIGYDTGDRVPFDGWVYNYNDYVSQDAWMLPFWWTRLMEDPTFRTALKARWTDLRSGALSTAELLKMVDDTAAYLEGNQAISRNFGKWNIGGLNYSTSIRSLKSYLEERTAWMDAEISAY